MRWPTSVMAAQSPMILTRQSFLRSSARASMAAGVVTFCAVSIETVTLLSDVEIKSTEIPCSRKTLKASARKPTWCHISIDSMETSVMPERLEIAFSCGWSSLGAFEMTLPSHSGRAVHFRYSGMPVARTGEMLRGCRMPPPAEAISCASR
jgi:hypothetical protein